MTVVSVGYAWGWLCPICDQIDCRAGTTEVEASFQAGIHVVQSNHVARVRELELNARTSTPIIGEIAMSVIMEVGISLSENVRFRLHGPEGFMYLPEHWPTPWR